MTTCCLIVVIGGAGGRCRIVTQYFYENCIVLYVRRPPRILAHCRPYLCTYFVQANSLNPENKLQHVRHGQRSVQFYYEQHCCCSVFQVFSFTACVPRIPPLTWTCCRRLVQHQHASVYLQPFCKLCMPRCSPFQVFTCLRLLHSV